jgi:hypothetical protein
VDGDPEDTRVSTASIVRRLAGVTRLRRFEVHHRFLSAFVHPVPAGYDLVYGRNRPTEAPRYDHCAAEPAVLYVNELAASELKFLKRMTTRTPACCS